MLMIEEYPASNNPNKDTVKDVVETLNFDLAEKVTKLAISSLASLGGIMETIDGEVQP